MNIKKWGNDRSYIPTCYFLTRPVTSRNEVFKYLKSDLCVLCDRSVPFIFKSRRNKAILVLLKQKIYHFIWMYRTTFIEIFQHIYRNTSPHLFLYNFMFRNRICTVWDSYSILMTKLFCRQLWLKCLVTVIWYGMALAMTKQSIV